MGPGLAGQRLGFALGRVPPAPAQGASHLCSWFADSREARLLKTAGCGSELTSQWPRAQEAAVLPAPRHPAFLPSLVRTKLPRGGLPQKTVYERPPVLQPQVKLKACRGPLDDMSSGSTPGGSAICELAGPRQGRPEACRQGSRPGRPSVPELCSLGRSGSSQVRTSVHPLAHKSSCPMLPCEERLRRSSEVVGGSARFSSFLGAWTSSVTGGK